MTGGGYVRVNTESLRRAGEGFHDRAVALDGILQRLNAALASEGDCWGDDTVGKRFEENYIEPRDSTLKMFGKLVKGLDGIKARVDQMAQNYQVAEEASRPK
ncbi:WXG100 family type VII secretion target [Actinomadura roseirufa]|uniref:WXG100 family type VII secretion target n=1 Tax=Actinomadura roseirufa TaxID=2094049 RepID=UPI001040F698|nr:WXG100 family type VII secretion target [Actinomadura roseirufa]